MRGASLLDIMLPKMNGLNVLKSLRAEGVITPVILLTTRSGMDDKVSSRLCLCRATMIVHAHATRPDLTDLQLST